MFYFLTTQVYTPMGETVLFVSQVVVCVLKQWLPCIQQVLSYLLIEYVTKKGSFNNYAYSNSRDLELVLNLPLVFLP